MEGVLMMNLQQLRCERGRKLFWTALAGWWVVGGLGAAAAVAQEAEPAQPNAVYRLQPGDEVAVSVVPQKEYDCVGIVAPDGRLYLKNVGAIPAEGQTVAHIEQYLTELLDQELRNPRVRLTLLKFTKLDERVTVTGAVARPGPVLLEPELRVLKAIELAGGATREALLGEVTIVHKDLTTTKVNLSDAEHVSDSAQNLLLKDGDSIEVPRLLAQVTVGGAVMRPGSFDLTPDLRVRRAVDLAGGLKDGADLGRIQIIHKDLTSTTVDLDDEEKLTDEMANRMLKDGDSIYVPLKFKQGIVSITGAVDKPGSFELKSGWSLDDLLGAADKPKAVANLERVQLKRAGRVQELNLRAIRRGEGDAQRLMLEPGDEVHIPEYDKRIMLFAPGQEISVLPLREDGTTIADFFRETEDLSALDPQKADLAGVRLWRSGQKKETKVNLARALGDPGHAQNVALQHGDVLVVYARDTRDKSMDWIRTLGPLGIFANVLFRLF
jgi:protein involved in polysaccharide export with SLBB domain